MAFMGMRGNGDWVTDQRPKNWRQGMLHLYPNGDMQLTGMMSMLKSEKTDDPEFNWWSKSLPGQRATLSDSFIYDDAALTTAYSGGTGTVGTTVYCKTTAAYASEFRAGHKVTIRLSTSYAQDIGGKVTASVQNGASSYVAVKLLEADGSDYLSTNDTLLITGSMQSEGAGMPDTVAYDPTKYYNYTEISMTPLEITRTARMTRLRTEDQYREAKREALELHGIEMEKSLIFGRRYEGTGDNGKPERSTGGLLWWLSTYNGIQSDYTTDDAAWAAGGPDIGGDDWETGGDTWLTHYLEQIFRYGPPERLGICGSGVLLAIDKLVKSYGTYQLQPKTTDYGIKVVEWTTPFGVLNLRRHPLFSYEATNRNSLLIIEPSQISYRYILDTKFIGEKETQNTGWTWRDGTKEGFLTEWGLEVHHTEMMGWLNGFGGNNPA